MSNVAEKVRKLLRLSTSSNPNEAALAAAKAQALIDEHNLTEAMLTLETGAGAEEKVRSFEEPLHNGGKQLERWRSYLAMVIAKANGCQVWQSGGDLRIIGRPSDAEAVRYLFAYLVNEVDRLAKDNAYGNGRTYVNNYRLGVVDTIAKKIESERDRLRYEAREAASRSGGLALVRLNTALVHIDRRHDEAVRFGRAHLGLRTGKASRSKYDGNARSAGRRDGQSIRVNASAGNVGSGQKYLNGGAK